MEPSTTTTHQISIGDGVSNAGNANIGIQAGTGEPAASSLSAGLIPASASVVNAPLSQIPTRADLPTFPSPGGEGPGVRAGQITPITESPIALPLTFTIPAHDLSTFARLPQDCRDDVHRKLTCLKNITLATSVSAGCKAQASLMHGARGFSATRLRTQYYEYLRTQDWRCLIDRSRAGSDFTHRGGDVSSPHLLPAEFIEFFRGFCERYQRKSRPARRELIHIWRTHHGYPRGNQPAKYYKAIPGYTTWPAADPKTGIPVGWSEANLYRYSPTKFELTAARIGRTAAADYRPKVYTTRVGLHVGQYYQFDDQEYDLKINYLGPRGGSKAMRPLGLNALDLFSACLFAYSFKPTIWNAETEAKEKLKERDMLWFVVHVLTNIGYRDDEIGTILLVEHGTAAIRELFEQRIFDATHGRVRVQRGGIGGHPAADFQFDGASRGNFRFKAALESIFNLVRNEMAALPGNVGKDRLHSPEELHGRDHYNLSLIKAGLTLAPETAALLRMPFMEWHQFTDLCLSLYARINSRTDHDLEGWQKSGLTTNEWRLNDTQPWLNHSDFLALPPCEQAIAQQLIQTKSNLARVRQLAPIEVFEARRKTELQRAPTFILPQLLGPEFGTERKIRNSLFEFEDADISPGDPLRYLARCEDQTILPDGTYLTYLNPFHPDHLCVCDSAGRYLGTCPRWASPTRSDTDAIHRQMGQARKIESELLAPIARRGAELAREKLEMHRHNAAILSRSGRVPPRTPLPGPDHDQADVRAALENPDNTTPWSDASETSPRQSPPSPGGEGRGEGGPSEISAEEISSLFASDPTPEQ